MPIIRKVVRVGPARAVTLPASWLRFFEEKYGCQVREVLMEVDRCLTIEPRLRTAAKGEVISNEGDGKG